MPSGGSSTTAQPSRDARFSAGNVGRLLLAVVLISLLAACHAAAPITLSSRPYVPTPWPVTFKKHDFAAYCYNTRRCSVIYANDNVTRAVANSPSGPPPTPDYRERWSNASFLGVSNFPPPARVRWTSIDDIEHEAVVDLAEIFRDEHVLHRVAREDIPDGWGQDVRPNIYIEVNDRKVSVLMRTHVATREPQVPGNVYSNFRSDTILVWSKTY